MRLFIIAPFGKFRPFNALTYYIYIP